MRRHVTRVEIGIAKGEPEEDEADRYTEQRDESAEAPGRHARRIYPRVRSQSGYDVPRRYRPTP